MKTNAVPTSATAAPNRPTRRLSREDWIAFARKTLIRLGIESVKVDQLARRAKVTRGSFYHHFKNREDLLDALLRDWEVRNLVKVSEIRDGWKRHGFEFADIATLWLGEERDFLDFDIAIRSWARQTTEVSDVVRRVDGAWISLLESLYEHLGFQGDDALVRARIAYFHQVGYHALAFREDQAERFKLVPVYYTALTGRQPDRRLTDYLTGLQSARNGAKPSRSRQGG